MISVLQVPELKAGGPECLPDARFTYAAFSTDEGETGTGKQVRFALTYLEMPAGTLP